MWFMPQLTAGRSRARFVERLLRAPEENPMAVLMVYDPTIRDHLARKDVSLKELQKLRDLAHDQIRQQGNLALAVLDLQKEIDRRSGLKKP
jgi:hypothetical protein